MKPDRRESRRRVRSPVRPAARRPTPNRSSGKSVSGFTITWPSIAVRPRDAADQNEIVHQLAADRRSPRLKPSDPGTPASPSCRRAPRRRSTSVRIAAAVRPCRPITRPRSPGAINSSTSVCPRARARVTRTASGWSASALATTSTTSRARLTTRAVPVASGRSRPAGAARHPGDQRADRVRRLRADLQPVVEPIALRASASPAWCAGCRTRAPRRSCCRAPRASRSRPRGRTAASSNPSVSNELLTSALSSQLPVVSSQLVSCDLLTTDRLQLLHQPFIIPRPPLLLAAVPAMPPSCLSIFFICTNCFSSLFTSSTDVPLPFAIRLRRCR